MERTKGSKLVQQIKKKAETPVKKKKKYNGNTDLMIDTGSTLLNLAISGGRIRGGGIPAGIFVEVFGPNSAGKTVVLCEMAGDVQRKGGEVQFNDPEGRLNKQFAKIFDFRVGLVDYKKPDTVVEVFRNIRKWKPKPDNTKYINATFTDSLAALSTELEMGDEKGDKMGMKRAKDFSQEFRRTCRLLVKSNMLMVCSNQVRVNANAGPFEEKFTVPGGTSPGFYASLRLSAGRPKEIRKVIKFHGKEVTRTIGVETEFKVYKSSIWKPYHKAKVIINFDYGIDDIRANLQFVKEYSTSSMYTLGDRTLSKSLEKAIKIVEDEDLELELKKEVIDLWEEIESEFSIKRKPKRR